MEDQKRRGILIGTILVVLGVGLFAMQFIEGALVHSVVLAVIGIAFLVAYFVRRSYGLLIPGCILVGIALGSIGEETVFGLGDFSLFGLGIGFIAIYVIDLVYRRSTHWWPLIPGGILVVVGLGRITNLRYIFERGWPLILVLVGLLLLAGAFGLFGRKKA